MRKLDRASCPQFRRLRAPDLPLPRLRRLHPKTSGARFRSPDNSAIKSLPKQAQRTNEQAKTLPRLVPKRGHLERRFSTDIRQDPAPKSLRLFGIVREANFAVEKPVRP
jgi:hypothetical protein